MTLPKSKTCPRCKKNKPLDQFGTRMMDGIKRPQSHCVSCRGLKPKSHRKPKKISKKKGDNKK